MQGADGGSVPDVCNILLVVHYTRDSACVWRTSGLTRDGKVEPVS